MSIRILLIFAISLLCTNLFSQALEEAKEAFPDAKYVLAESLVDVSFKTLKNGNLVSVVEYTDQFLALQQGVVATFAVLYDEYSEINKFKTSGVERDEYYESNGIFHSDTRVKYSKISFGKAEEIKVASAEKQFNDMRYMSNFYITKSVPCLRRKISILIPDDMEIDLLPFYLEENGVEYKEEKTKKGTLHTYYAENVDGFDDSPGLPGLSHLYPHILVLPKSYQQKGKQVNLFRNTKDQYDWYRSLVGEIGNENEELKTVVNDLIKDTKDEDKKIENIFYWVQDNIRYIAFEDGIAGFKPESCQNVFKKRYGDCKGMANLMKEMLLIAGFDARLCWIGTKSVVYGYHIPSLSVDNHMICAVKKNDDFIFLDGTEKFINIDNYAERIQGQEALIENGEDYILKRVPTAKSQDNLMTLSLDLALEEKIMNGKVQASFMGESKSGIRNNIAFTKQNKIEDAASNYLRYGNENVTIKDVVLSDLGQHNKQSKIEGEIQLKEFVSNFGKETYVYMDPFKIFDNYDLKKDRKFEYWFDYKIKDEVVVKLDLKGTKKISALPEKIEISNEDFNISGFYTEANDIINYHLSIEIPDAKISKSNIENWNLAIKQLREFYSQPIILTDK